MRRRFLPPQHGAWAMLAVPYMAGIVVAGWSWVAAPLAGAWLAGYLLSYYLLQAIKTGRPGRWRDQIALYATLTLPLLSIVVLARPEVLWYAPAYAALWSVNAWYARRRRERALLNDLASVVQSCLLVFVVATITGTSPGDLTGVFVVCVAYFAGTALFVKTMIRERNNAAYRRWSIGYHVGALLLVSWLGPLVAGLFTWLLVRAWLLSGRRLAPSRVGLIEIGNSLLLLAVVGLTWG